MVRFYVIHDMVVQKVHDVNPFKTRIWLEKNIRFNIKTKKIKLQMIFNKTFTKYSIMLFMQRQCKMLKSK